MKIGIIGSGHAGVAAAATIVSANNKNIQVTLFSNESYLPYFRPRIPAVAFGQCNPEDATMHPEKWYIEKGIQLHLNKEVKSVDSFCNLSTHNNEKYSFDKLLIATGAKPIIPPFALNKNQNRVVPLWDMKSALNIRKNITEGKKIIIIGGGAIGIETALRAKDAGLEVIVIERAKHFMERNLSPKASILLSKIIANKGIKIYTNETVLEIDDSSTKIKLKTDETEFTCDFVILAIGADVRSPLAENTKLKTDRGILVNDFLLSSNPNIFSAGDCAQIPNILNPCSAIRATDQGKIVGVNSAQDSASNYKKYLHKPISLQLKYKELELYTVGQTSEEKENSEEILEYDENKNIYRAIVKKNNVIVGIQMIGSNLNFKTLEAQLKIK